MVSSSLPASVVNLMKATFGVGIVSLPHFFAQTGILAGAILMSICGLVNAYALHLLALCVLKFSSKGKEVPTFKSLAEATFGSGAAATAVPVGIIIEGLGIAAAFFVCMGDILPEVAAYFGLSSSPWNSRYFWITIIGWGVELPLSCQSNMDSLKFSSLIGNFGILYILLLFIVFATGVIDLPAVVQPVTFLLPDESEYTTRPGMIQAVPIFIFVFICSLNLPTLVLELADHSVRRVDMMICGAVSLTTLTYIGVGILGSYSFGASVDPNSLKNFPNAEGSLEGFISIFARVGVCLNLMGSIPLYFHPMRGSISELMFKKPASELTRTVRILLTLVIFILTWAVALWAPGIDVVMAYVGSTIHMINGFILPALFYLFYLLVKSQGDDTVGVSLPAMPSRVTGNVESGEARETLVMSFSVTHGSLRRSAWCLLVVSVVLIPLLLVAETYKLATEG